MQAVSLITVDWGTSNLRVAFLSDAGVVLEERCSKAGMSSLQRGDFEAALIDLVGDVLPDTGAIPVVCCGMVGSRQGWHEAPYMAAPCRAPKGNDAVAVPVQDSRMSVWILPGIKQLSPADVMRGEETQIAGFLAENPKFDGVLCLPGTHTKWVRISAEEIVSFQTYMTGELYALLAQHSVLRHSVSGKAFDDSAFVSAVEDAIARPQAFGAQLFGLRAGTLVANLNAAEAQARLSGLLIGLELAGARPYWLGMEIGIIGSPEMASLYQKGLAAQGASSTIYDVTGLTIAGLAVAYKEIKETV